MTVTLLRDIPYSEIRGRQSVTVFFKTRSKIEYDTKQPITKKRHALIYQQGPYYGTIGDCCDYLTHDELLDLERRGFISINGRIKRGKK